MAENNYQTQFWIAREIFLEAIEEYQKNDSNFFEFARSLEQLHLEKCKLISSRENLLNYLPKNAVVAEVGTQSGYFARKMIDVTQPSKLHIIDIDWSLFEREKFLTEIESGVLQIHQGDSVEVLARFPDEYFDWIYIDADHSYKGVYRDIQCGYKKLKANGILVFNDYTVWSPLEAHPYGILRAVNEFCLTQGWEFIFLALSTSGYYDVAIRKIDSETLDVQLPVEIDLISNQVQVDIVQLQYDKAKLAYQLQKIQQDIENPESRLQQLQQEIKFWQSQYKQTQYELKQRQHSQTELEQSQSQLQHSQTELEQSQLQLQHSQTELEQSQLQLQHSQTELEQSQLQLQHSQTELAHFQARVIAMQSSKFWKLRTQWFKIKKLFGIAIDTERYK